jgi:hypothetical protein
MKKLSAILATVALVVLTSGASAAWFDITSYGGPPIVKSTPPPALGWSVTTGIPAIDVCDTTDLTLFVWADSYTPGPAMGTPFISVGLDVIPMGTGQVTNMAAVVHNPVDSYHYSWTTMFYYTRWGAINPGIPTPGVGGATAGVGIDDMVGTTAAPNKYAKNVPNAYSNNAFLFATIYLHVDGAKSDYINLYLGVGSARNFLQGGALASPLYFGHDAATAGPEVFPVPQNPTAFGSGLTGGMSVLPEFVIHIIPEPATMGLMGLGTLGLGFLRRRR